MCPFDIPESTVTNPEFSEIRLYFRGQGLTFITKDLGYNSGNSVLAVACRGVAGITPVSGNTLTCEVHPGIDPFIKVTNFNAILATTGIKIELAKFKNPNGDFSVEI